MTNIGSLILILVCVGIGYVFEPIFFSGSKQYPIAAAPEVAETEDNEGLDDGEPEVQPVPPVPEPANDALQVDLSKITSADFPARVILKVAYTISDEASGVTMQLKNGAKVKPLRLEGNQLVFQPIGLPLEGKTEVGNTDFKVLAVPLMLKRLQDEAASNDASVTEMDSDPMPEEEQEPEPDPIPVPDPEPVVEVTPVPPVPDPAPDADADKQTMDGATIVDLMKASVADGKVTEFDAAQVVAWKAGEAMEFDGNTYQTGLVTFKAETILGMQEHDAIALIQNGAVVKWMWAKTKLEMR